ncbi:MAG: tetratricopeptide repeat protein [Gemmataceae bacterium]|nr:tetratricopeptide repeat protein [Gemmataceae bacterium]
MRRISLGVPGRLTVATLLVLGLAQLGQADEGLRKRLDALNQTTGDDPVAARLKELLAKPAETKKLIAFALTTLKDKNQPLTFNGAYLLAQAAGELKDLKGAEAFYRICMNQSVKLLSTKKVLLAYGGLIDLLYENKKFTESGKVCRELLELKSGDGKPRIYYLAITNRFGEPDFVEDEDFDAAKRLRPGVHRLLIQAIAKQGKYDQALKLIDNLLRAQDNWQERQLKAWVLREAGKYVEAARTYEDVLERIEKDNTLEQEDKDSYLERYRYILSNVYVDLKQIDKAAEKLKALIAKKPDEAAYYNDLGYIWADHNMNLEESEKLIRKALELDRARRKKMKVPAEGDRDNGAYLDSLGWVLYRQKKFKEAKEVMLEAVKDKASQHIEIYDHLGDIHMALGERAEALAAWRRGLEVAGEGARERQRRAEVEKKLQKHTK